ncbi:MAG: SDR family oxidoreductase [Chloroflexi bacterium]|nr:SDR family oxidoreductase [Chloroflexota bacterium]
MSRQSLGDQVAVVTGAARGIGKAIALTLASYGAAVALLDVEPKTAEATAQYIKNETGNERLMTLQTDVSNYSSVKRAMSEVADKIGFPSILVNNAGIYTSSPLIEVTPEEWNNTIAVNLSGVFFCSQVVAPYLMERKQGRIINIASTGGKVGWPRNHAYCASKAGVIGLTRVLALDLAPYSVTVNSICPGNTNTDMMLAVDANIARNEGLQPGVFLLEQKASIPLKRFAEPEDVAAMVAFLASDDARHITGQAINVDGGTVMY